MRPKLFLGSILILLHFSALSQFKCKNSYVVDMDTLSVGRYTIRADSGMFKQKQIHVEFGNFVIHNEKAIDEIRNGSFVQVDLVYTLYPADQDFSSLNRKRIEYLHILFPELFQNPGVRWRIIAQTDCNASNARSLFHGFNITYREGATMELAKADASYVTRIFKGEIASPDSIVLKVFQRNKFKDASVVADFTGSMAPYVAQVFAWYELTFAKGTFKAFCFFNDGDMKSDIKKVTGETGGIYVIKHTNKEEIYKCAQQCINGGCGGDAQENDVEAILETLKKFPETKEIILIADNLAPLRDLKLADKIKVPVRVVLCGTQYAPINTQFLELAYITKGSVHTVEEDITDLHKLLSGSKITIGKSKFQFIGGRFVATRT